MADERTVLVLAQVTREQRHSLMAEAAAAACELHHVDSLGAAVLSLATRPPVAVLVDLDLDEAEELCRKVRTKRRAVDIAIFGLAREVTGEVFAQALRWGVDDVSSSVAEGALASRLVALPADPSSPPTARGDAVVATMDEREFVIGRLLANAGFEVEYARDPVTLQQLASLERMRLVVTTESIGPLPDLIKRTRRRGRMATWIALAPPDQVATVERALAGTPRAGVVSNADPFEHILFVSNELAATASEARRERRVLHGSLVRFRSSPRGPFEHGFTYNVSPGGLYVRSLAPPVNGQVYMEVQAPNTSTLVRLEGRVAWRRGFARLGSATAPPGFGVGIMGGSEQDRATWARGCTQLLVARRAPEKPPRPPGTAVEREAQPKPVALGAEIPPRLFEIEELDNADLDSLLPDSIRMVEEASGGISGESDAARQPALDAGIQKPPPVPSLGPVRSGKTIKLDAFPLPGSPTPKTEPLSSALPQEPLAPEPKQEPPSPAPMREPPSPAPTPSPTDRDRAEPSAREVAAAADLGPSPKVPTSSEVKPPQPAPSPKVATQGDNRLPSAAEAHPIEPKREYPSDTTPGPASDTPPTPPAEALKRRNPGRSVAIGLILGCLLAVLTVVGWTLLGIGEQRLTADSSPAVAKATTGPDRSHAKRPRQRQTPLAGKPLASAKSEQNAAVEDAPEDAGADAEPDPQDAESEASPDAAGAVDPIAAAREKDEAVDQQPTAELIDVPEGELMHYEAYFVVASSANTRVYSNGIDVGPTNAKNKVRCGLRNVRLGDAPGKWRTRGYTVQIVCMKHNRISLEPTQ